MKYLVRQDNEKRNGEKRNLINKLKSGECKMKYYLIALIVCVCAFSLNVKAADDWSTLFQGGEDNIVDKLADTGNWKGKLGMNFRHDLSVEEGDEFEAGWGYFDFGWESGDVHGLQLGLGGIAITELWDGGSAADSLFDDGGAFGKKARWTEAYLKYHIPNSETHLIIGRASGKQFAKPATGDGDFHQGIGIIIKDIPRLTIKASAINAWLNNASAKWDLDGMDSDWEDMDSYHDESPGDFVYTLMAEIDAVPDWLTLTPYVQHYKNVATVIGSTYKLERPVSENLNLGVDGAYAIHYEDTPDAVSATDEDVSQLLVHPYGKMDNFQLGFGYYSMSDDIAPMNTFGEGGDDFEDTFVTGELDPTTEDLAKYGEQPGNDTFFVDAGYSHGPFDFSVVYAWCDNALIEDGWEDKGKAKELNIKVKMAFTEKLSGELAYINLSDDYTDDKDRSVDYIAGGLSYKF